jgi:hypothetical protein
VVFGNEDWVLIGIVVARVSRTAGKSLMAREFANLALRIDGEVGFIGVNKKRY